MAEVEESSHTEVSVEQQEDFSALLRALTRAHGFALYLVECNVPVFRRKVAEAIRGRLDREVVDVDLSDVDRGEDRPSIDYVLEQRLAEAPVDAVVFVWGLDSLLPSTTGDEAITRHTLNEVNWRRGAWTQLDRPLVVWLPEYAIRFLARNAPDFFDWNSGVYSFEASEDDRPFLFEASLEDLREGGTMENLSVEKKRKREAYLRGLKREYSTGEALDRSARGNVLYRLGRLYLARGDLERAQNEFEEALEVRTEIGDRSGEALTRHQLATIALEQGDYGEARAEFEEALEIRREIGNRSGEAATLHNLASIALEQGEYDRARDQFERALAIRQKIDDCGGEAGTLSQLGILAGRGYGRWREGLRLLHLGFSILHSMEDTQVEQVDPWIHQMKGKLGYNEDDLREDIEYAQQSYAEDRGWSLIQEAFPHADLPDDVPPTE